MYAAVTKISRHIFCLKEIKPPSGIQRNREKFTAEGLPFKDLHHWRPASFPRLKDTITLEKHQFQFVIFSVSSSFSPTTKTSLNMLVL